MRKKRRERLTEDNHERWLVSYADFVTLLFAFFVVMYSISSVNEGKYKVLSETLNRVFGEVGVIAPADIVQVGDPVRDLVVLPEAFPLARQDNPLTEIEEDIQSQAVDAIRQAASQQRVYDELAISLQDYITHDLIDVIKNGDRIEININARMLFGSGDTRLSREALDALRQVSLSLLNIPNPVQVEGHTDNVPITNQLYRSNWELSAARAAAVVHFLSAQGVPPSRLAAVGMGEHRPVAENETEEGRAANRRVTLLILGAEPEIFEPDQIVPWAEGPAVPVQ
jgi:chemotaxis protein MotB